MNEAPSQPRNRDAYSSIRRAIAKADSDPLRPACHFRPPAQWMNDPNGPVFHNGQFHLFYQFNPYSDSWDHIHWGHARTRDFLTWEHLPIALFPQEELHEGHCFSGCCVLAPDQNPLIVYTSVHHKNPRTRPNSQRAAVGDGSLIRWSQQAGPLLHVSDVPFPIRDDWRDPFAFSYGDERFLIVSAVAMDRDDLPVVLTFRERAGRSRSWEYLGLLYESGDDYPFLECPNLVRLGEKSVLIFSPCKTVEYRCGVFSPATGRLEVESSGIVDHGPEYYATNTITDDSGRTVMLAWVRGFPEGRGWNGCLALPREISIATDGTLRQRPVRESQRLRQRHSSLSSTDLAGDRIVLEEASASNLELLMTFTPGPHGSVSIVFEGDVSECFRIECGPDLLQAGEIRIPVDRSVSDELCTVHLLCDRSVVEVFVNEGRYCITRVIASLPSCTRVVIERRRATLLSVDYWRLRALDFTFSREFRVDA